MNLVFVSSDAGVKDRTHFFEIWKNAVDSSSRLRSQCPESELGQFQKLCSLDSMRLNEEFPVESDGVPDGRLLRSNCG